jgi:hypothetical protein
VVVDDLDVCGAFRRPNEAQAELVVDPNTMLSGPSALQGLKPVAGWDSKIFESVGPIQLLELAARDDLDVSESLYTNAVEEPFSIGALERLDRHVENINASRY